MTYMYPSKLHCFKVKYSHQYLCVFAVVSVIAKLDLEDPDEGELIQGLPPKCSLTDHKCLQKECPKRPFERFHRCLAACPQTCENYVKIGSQVCNKCVAGCVCIDGFVRNEYERCVPHNQCKRNFH
ncbi:uncharacterized protein LOC123296400 [Chrysoperla carnea]|uniref:uncharacterized protein LOC123296400 n=1 Tax=Chrysoperla carnea TaxID=189513 RepID=UPI001D06D084|nr:uncharacterized protein LOC123296400 [Chrysoperla carnea]